VKTLRRLVLPQAPSPIMTNFLKAQDQHVVWVKGAWCDSVGVTESGCRRKQEDEVQCMTKKRKN